MNRSIQTDRSSPERYRARPLFRNKLSSHSSNDIKVPHRQCPACPHSKNAQTAATAAANPLLATAAFFSFSFSAQSLLACLPLSAASARAFFTHSSFSRFSRSRTSFVFSPLLKTSLPLSAVVKAVEPLTFLDFSEVELAIVERRLALVLAAGDVVVPAVAVLCFGIERDAENVF